MRVNEPLPQSASLPCAVVAVNHPNVAVRKAKVFDLITITPALTSKKTAFRRYVLNIIGYPSKIIVFSESK